MARVPTVIAYSFFFFFDRIINADKSFNETLYQEYGPLRISGFFAITYGIGFAALSSVLTHTYLYHGRQIIEQWKRSRSGEEDIHMKLMRRYVKCLVCTS